MPTYRLRNGPGRVLATYLAGDDDQAIAQGHELAKPHHDGLSAYEDIADFEVDRRAGDDDWQLLAGWVPRL